MSDTVICSFCGKAFSKKMRLCPYCGGEHKKESLHTATICPKCTCEMITYEYMGNDLEMCPKCNGLWLDSREFKTLTSERNVFKDETIPDEYLRKPFTHPKKYLPCPVCGSLMPRINFRKISGVLIDLCRDHGVWLEAGELEQIRCFIANGGLHDLHDAEIFMNKEAIESLDTRLSDVEFMQKLLHHWNFKRWIFSK
jgi:Zn-finger nucleic acid-binding protein